MSDLDDELARADRNLGASDTRDDQDTERPRERAKEPGKKSRFSKPRPGRGILGVLVWPADVGFEG